ncbi:MAG TPA: protein kinase [Hyalangium sp.]|jgi:serine/threonine protein kinase|nr:protein kinase [Hyalangium sp.]
MTDTKTPDSLRPGDLVGPWRVEGYAGRGSYGAVYRARRADQPGSKPVALKIAVFPSDPRFGREVELLSRHHHPGMPRLLDQGVWHASDEVAHPYFVMEWICGRSLYEWAHVHNPSYREVLRVLAQVARTLEVLHRGEYLHRDVKGDNILVGPDGRAVLTDFGSATWKGAPPLTEWVVPPNTREYRSPESLHFEWTHWRKHGVLYETRPADDLYALGVAAYRLVTGGYPPPGTVPETLKEQHQVPLPQRRPVHEFNKRVVPELSALIERMLAKEPEARGTARELAETAKAAAEHAGPGANVPLFGLERPEAKVQAVPNRAIPPSSSEPPAAKAEAVPVRGRTKPRSPSWESRGGVAVLLGGMLLFLAAIVWRGPSSPAELPSMVRIEAPEVEFAPDGGTRGLGDDAFTTRVDSQEVPALPESTVAEFPTEPLPGQRRPPCRRSGEVIINGGCWLPLTTIKPPCDGDDEYERQGACYRPARDRRLRPPTSKKAQ